MTQGAMPPVSSIRLAHKILAGNLLWIAVLASVAAYLLLNIDDLTQRTRVLSEEKTVELILAGAMKERVQRLTANAQQFVAEQDEAQIEPLKAEAKALLDALEADQMAAAERMTAPEDLERLEDLRMAIEDFKAAYGKIIVSARSLRDRRAELFAHAAAADQAFDQLVIDLREAFEYEASDEVVELQTDFLAAHGEALAFMLTLESDRADAVETTLTAIIDVAKTNDALKKTVARPVFKHRQAFGVIAQEAVLVAQDVVAMQATAASVLDITGAMSQAVLDDIQATATAIEARGQEAKNSMYYIGPALFLLAIVLSLLARSAIVIPLHRVAAYAREVAEGDLDARITGVARLDRELGMLARAITTMVDSLKEQIAATAARTSEVEHEAQRAREALAMAEDAKRKGEAAHAEGMLEAASLLEGVAQQIDDNLSQIAAQVQEVHAGATHQAELTSDSEVAVNELSAATSGVASIASQAAREAENMREQAHEGVQVVGRSVAVIGEVTERSEQLRTDMNALKDHSEAIEHITSVISDIADQTNLLALNAAIEAARAGEAGKGFAVVADEVRKLAEKTMTATKEVREAVGSIQSGVDNAQGSVVQAVESISGARELVESTGGFFDALNDLIASSAGQSSEIAASVQEQNAAGEEIRRLMADTSRIAQTTAEGMNISGRSLNELTQLSAKLRQLITQLGSAVPTQRPGENEPADEDALDDA